MAVFAASLAFSTVVGSGRSGDVHSLPCGAKEALSAYTARLDPLSTGLTHLRHSTHCLIIAGTSRHTTPTACASNTALPTDAPRRRAPPPPAAERGSSHPELPELTNPHVCDSQALGARPKEEEAVTSASPRSDSPIYSIFRNRSYKYRPLPELARHLLWIPAPVPRSNLALLPCLPNTPPFIHPLPLRPPHDCR